MAQHTPGPGRGPIVAFVALVALVGACTSAPSATAAPSLTDCLTDYEVVPITGIHATQVEYRSPSSETTFDARGATFTSSPADTLYPVSIGKDTTPRYLCVVGGTVLGEQARDLTWDEVKEGYSGSGLRVGGNRPYVVDGLRVDNVADGIRPRGTEDRYPKDGDGFTIRNTYLTYIRDDCVENDDIAGGVIRDSLFDGCYTGISERPTSTSPQWDHPAPAGETLLVDHLLLRLQAMPGVRGSNDPAVLGHGQLFKWSEVANHLVVRNSVFYVETVPNSDSAFPFPAGATVENVTIVWGADAPFEWDLPQGATLTTDVSVWERARAEWLDRHGCTSFASCTKLTAPDPLPGSGSDTKTVFFDADDTPGRLDVRRLDLIREPTQNLRVEVRTFGRWRKRLLRGAGPDRVRMLFDTSPGGGHEYHGTISGKGRRLLLRVGDGSSRWRFRVRLPDRRTAVLRVPEDAPMAGSDVRVLVRTRSGRRCGTVCRDRAPDAGPGGTAPARRP